MWLRAVQFCTYQFIHCIVYCCLFVSLPCVVLFGLMATRLNKHYYYYYSLALQRVQCSMTMSDDQ